MKNLTDLVSKKTTAAPVQKNVQSSAQVAAKAPVAPVKKVAGVVTSPVGAKAEVKLDLNKGVDQAKFAIELHSALDISGRKTLDLCKLLHQAVDAYAGKKKVIRSEFRETLGLTPNQFSRMEDIGAKTDLFKGAASLPKSVLSLKLLVKIAEADEKVFGQIKAHLSEGSESSSIKFLSEAVKAKDYEKQGMLEVVNKVGMKKFLASPYTEPDHAGKVIEPILDLFTSLLKEELNTKFNVEDENNSKARSAAISRVYSDGFLDAFLGFLNKLNTDKFIDFSQIEDQAGDIEHFATEYVATKKAKLLVKEAVRAEKLEKKQAKAAQKAAEEAAKVTTLTITT